MTDLVKQARDHLSQCRRNDDAEQLISDLADEIDRLTHEMEATKEAARAREAMLRGALGDLYGATDSCVDLTPDIMAKARAALNGESGNV